MPTVVGLTSAAPAAAPRAAAAPSEPGLPADPASGTWPCSSCSAVVPLELSACPACGASFLARIAGDGGRHRSSDAGGGLARMSRPARLVAGLGIGFLIAIVVPVLLSLLG